jgi:hypothetical protein
VAQFTVAGQILGTQFTVDSLGNTLTVCGTVEAQRAFAKYGTPFVFALNVGL